MEGIPGALILVALLCFYFLPAMIAGIRNAGHSGAILGINFFLGWTVLGWIAALIWAIVEKPEEKEPVRELSADRRDCPNEV